MTLSKQNDPIGGIVKNASILSISLGITMVLSLFLRMYLPRLLGPEKIGVFFFAESISLIFFSFMPLGISVYISRKVPPDPDHAKDVLNSIIAVEIVAGVVIGLVMYIVLKLSGKPDETVNAAIIMGIFACFHIFHRDILKRMFIARNEVKLVSIINVITKVTLVLLAFVLLYIRANVYSIAISCMAAELLASLILLWSCYKRNLLKGKVSKSTITSILKIGLPFYIAIVFASIGSEVDMTMLGAMSTNTELGYFGAASKLIGVFLLFVPVLSSSLTPALSVAFSESIEKFGQLAQQALQFLLVLTFPLTMILILFVKEVALILYGEGFEYSHKIIGYLSPSLILTYINTMLGSGLSLSSSGRVLASIIFLGISLNVILNGIFIPFGLDFWGTGGAGLTVTLTTLFSEMMVAACIFYFYPAKIFSKKIAYTILIVELPAIIGIIYFDTIYEFELWQRIAIFALIPFYLFLSRVLTMKQLQFIYHKIRTK